MEDFLRERQYPMAPFETFTEHAERARSDEPYNDEFIARCREFAVEQDKHNKPPLGDGGVLADLNSCIPMWAKRKVFEGINIPPGMRDK